MGNIAKKKYERPQGEWNYEQVAFYGVCSNCGVAVTSNLADIFLYEEIGKCPYNTNFCPNCGASMKKEIKDVADDLFGKIMSGDFIGHCPTPRKEESE